MKGNFIELEIGDTNILALEFLKIIDDFDFDTVVYISKSGYLIGDAIGSISDKNILEIKSKRPGADKKHKYLPDIVNKLPKDLIYYLKVYERKLSYYDVVDDRTLYYDEEKAKEIKPNKILIFDDVVDTGYTLLKVKNEIETMYKDVEIRVAVLNYFTDRNSIKPDYYLYTDSVISAPWTIDSKEYKKFIKMYEDRNKSIY